MTLRSLAIAVILSVVTSDETRAGEAADRPQPAMVNLVMEDQTLSEVVEAINKQGPNRVEIAPEPRPTNPEVGRERTRPEPIPRRYHFREPTPVTFWEAVDRVCLASSLRPVLRSALTSRVVLVPASPNRGFSLNDGGFRVSLVGVTYLRGGPYTPSRDASTRDVDARKGVYENKDLQVALIVMAEPRMKIVEAHGLTVLAATDDQDRSMLTSEAGRQALTETPIGEVLQDGSFSFAIRLRFPDDPARIIRRIKAVVTIGVVEGSNNSFRPVRTCVSFEFKDVPMP